MKLQTPDNQDSQVVAGPYHPAFRQLVESRLWYDKIADTIKSVNSKVKDVKIDSKSI